MRYRFGDWELDDGRYELRCRGETRRISPKSYDVLRYLVRNGDRVVSKRELLQQIWTDEHVSEAVLPVQIRAVRKALADEGAASAKLIQTVHGRGYRLSASVEVLEDPPLEAGDDGGGDPFVGRREHLDALGVELDRIQGGRGSLVLIEGESGVGKTRLGHEALALAKRRGIVGFEGRAYGGDGAPPFWIWVQILRIIVGRFDPPILREALATGVPEVATLLPELRPHLPTRPDRVDIVSGDARFRLADGVATLLRNLGRREPLALLLDDLQWADPGALSVLRIVAREIRDAAVIVLATFRDVEREKSHLGRTLGEIARESHCRRLRLAGFDESEVAEYLRARLGRAPDAELVRTVRRLTDGSPFFLNEIELPVASGSTPVSPVSPLRPPAAIRDVLWRRIGTLSPECTDLMVTASVIGRRFGVHVLERVSGRRSDETLRLVDEAIGAGVVTDDAEDGLARLPVGYYRFSQALVRDVLYASLTGPKRAALHGRVGEVHEAVYGTMADQHLGELAEHFFAALPVGDVDRAVTYLRRAAAAAADALELDRALELIERAIRALEFRLAPDDDLRLELEVELGCVRFTAGHYGLARETLGAAADAARARGRDDLFADACLGLSSWPAYDRSPAGPERESTLPQAAAAVFAALPRDARVVRARLASARVLMTPAPTSDADAIARRDESERALEVARGTGDTSSIYEALRARLVSLDATPEVQQQLALADEMLHCARLLDSPTRRFVAHEASLRTHMVLGRSTDASFHFRAARALAERIDRPAFAYSIQRFRMARLVADGRFSDAWTLLPEVAALGEAAEDSTAEALLEFYRFHILYQQGRALESEQLYPWVTDARVYANGPSKAMAAELCLEVGDRATAAQHFQQLARDGFRFPRDGSWLWTASACAHLSVTLGSAADQERLYELLLPFRDLNVTREPVRMYAGSVRTALGKLAFAQGDATRAREHFEAALLFNERLGARAALLRAEYAFAHMLEHGSEPDRRRATLLRERAEKAAAALPLRLS